ncbi:alpha/beta fold hydrolase [Aquabacterium sp.]|uniref:alpha/beta fold hydrolase n=1 Tax=Aquabacterium sp. TaxID=1872578 RepID=UPI002CE904E8|nr:alpha/beta fold hydrolase [Aquabacterium sp.]HSW06638.1 alpha/beta fold hydrolase [Aquabacterium sp.]
MPQTLGRQQVQLQCKGYPGVVVDGQAVDLRLKRGIALLLLLFESARRLARAQIAETLWPDVPADVGRARLRRLCHEMNTALRGTLLVGDADTVWLDTTVADIDSDVAQVRRSARALLASPAAEGAGLCLQTVLAVDAHQVADGLSLDSELFNDWLDARRNDQRSLLVRALGCAAEQLEASGQAGLAAEAAARLLVLEPLSDTGHAVLIGARAQVGDAAAVEAAYFACADVMRSELGMRPSAQIEAAYQQALVRLRAAASHHAPLVSRLPPIRFADTDDGAVAFLTLGSGDVTLIVLFGLWSHVEVAWEEPAIRAILERLARRWRVVLMDRRGTGLSERVAVRHSLSAGVEDVEAVRRALGVDQVWLLGSSVGGTIAIDYAHTHPRHAQGLLLCGAGARSTWDDDYPWAPTTEQLDRWLGELRTAWGQATSWGQFAPSRVHDTEGRDWWARMLRQSLSRNGVSPVLRAFAGMDVRDRLPRLRLPTLIVQRRGDRIVREGAARYLAEHIAGSTLLVLPGEDHLIWCGDTDAVLEPMERFVSGQRW